MRFSLGWMLVAVSLFSIVAAVATSWYDVVSVLFVAGVLAPGFMFAYMAVVCLRDRFFGNGDRPLASSARDPLDITKYRPQEND